jgi:hypothetical protein
VDAIGTIITGTLQGTLGSGIDARAYAMARAILVVVKRLIQRVEYPLFQ